MEYACAELLGNISGDDSKWRTVVDFVIRSVCQSIMEENYTIFPVEGKRQVKDEETEITYIIYAVDADNGGRYDDTDLAVEPDTVRIQELRLEPQPSNDPRIKEFSLEV